MRDFYNNMDISFMSDFTYLFEINATAVTWTNATFFHRFSTGRNVTLSKTLPETEFMRIFLAIEGYTIFDLAFDLWD
jgi:hypothetical protein